eukprot:749465-Hanusia_phi.AAC.8
MCDGGDVAHEPVSARSAHSDSDSGGGRESERRAGRGESSWGPAARPAAAGGPGVAFAGEPGLPRRPALALRVPSHESGPGTPPRRGNFAGPWRLRRAASWHHVTECRALDSSPCTRRNPAILGCPTILLRAMPRRARQAYYGAHGERKRRFDSKKTRRRREEGVGQGLHAECFLRNLEVQHKDEAGRVEMIE